MPRCLRDRAPCYNQDMAFRFALLVLLFNAKFLSASIRIPVDCAGDSRTFNLAPSPMVEENPADGYYPLQGVAAPQGGYGGHVGWNRPARGSIIVPADINLDEFTRWVEELKASPYDHFLCVQEIAGEIELALGSVPPEIRTRIRETVAGYGEDARAKKKIPFFRNDRQISPTETRELISRVVRWSCRPSQYMRSANNDAMTKDFLLFPFKAVLESFELWDNREECLRGLSAFYAQELLKIGVSEEQCKRWPTICEERSAVIAHVSYMLSLRVDAVEGFSEDWREIERCHYPIALRAENLPAINRMLADLASDMDDIGDAARCAPLRVGEGRLVNGDQGSGVGSLYTLTRLPDDSDGKAVYEIELPVTFIDEHGLEDHYREEATNCLRENEKYFKGPDGESLRIRLATALPGGLTNDIRISSEINRSTSKNWRYDIGCSTMIHEFEHRMGFVDEYHETYSGVRLLEDGSVEYVEENATFPEFDCRTIGPRDSLMHDHDEAFKAVRPTKEITVCQCAPPGMVGVGAPAFPTGSFGGPYQAPATPEGIEQMQRAQQEMEQARRRCHESLDAIADDATACPEGLREASRTFTHKQLATDRFNRQLLSRQVDEYSYERAIRVQDRPPKRTSLFYPAQFRYLTRPGCRAANRTYIGCARNSKNTSRSAYGSGCGVDVPEICREGGQRWLR